MNTTENITVTDGRMKRALEKRMAPFVQKETTKIVQKELDKSMGRLGKVTKVYPYLDKAEVQLLKSKKKVLCKLPHHYMNNIIDLYVPHGTRDFCKKLKEPCVVPFAPIPCILLKIHDEDSSEYFIVNYYSPKELLYTSIPSPGHARLTCMTATNETYIEFGGKGLDILSSKIPKIRQGQYEKDVTAVDYADAKNVYTKEEIDAKMESDCCNGKMYKELLKVTENYKQFSNDQYTLFRGDCWTINNNFESSAAITSETLNDVTITGTFRTKSDMVGLYWNSKDLIQHPYISYGERSDYRGVVLDFDYTMTGCKDFSNNVISITIAANTGETYYLTMNRFINNGHVHIDFDKLTLLAGNEYLDKNGNTVKVVDETPLDVSDLKFIMFVIIPTNYEKSLNQMYEIMANVDYTCQITNISVTRGDICKERFPLNPHKYRLCEGYDDFYNLNPKRICKEMRKLGYTSWLDLYIGASHFYEKSGVPGDVIDVSDFNHKRTEKMVLDKNVPLNKSFIAWLDGYSKELKANDCDNLVVSVSMENMQPPTDWRQVDCKGNPALTGWIPSTFFYSPCHDEVAQYMQSVSEACLDIVVANDMKPILQMGEAWWWWNELDKPNQPPCFYDNATRQKYQSEHGVSMPEHESVWDISYDKELMYWLNQQLCIYSDKLREVVKNPKYTNGLYMALFFPPSVTDKDRVPKMMREVNYLEAAYSPAKLDVLQIEDYDWTTGRPNVPEEVQVIDRSHHPEVYKLGQKLGFPKDRIHYFGGFVQYPENAVEYWRYIKEAMDTAISKGFQEVFVWAGSQVRRDNKIIGYDNYELVQLLNQK